MSIHLAAMGPSRYRPEPVQASDAAGCLTTSRVAQREPMSLHVEHEMPHAACTRAGRLPDPLRRRRQAALHCRPRADTVGRLGERPQLFGCTDEIDARDASLAHRQGHNGRRLIPAQHREPHLAVDTDDLHVFVRRDVARDAE